MLLLNGLVQDFTFAARLKGQKEPLSTLFYLPPNPNVTYSAALMSKAEEMFVTGKAPYPVERTLLTSGMTAAGLKSLATGEKRLETPHLAVKYEVAEGVAVLAEVTPEVSRAHPPPVPECRGRRCRRRGRRVLVAARPAAQGDRRRHPRPGDVRRVPEAGHHRVELPQGRPRRGHEAVRGRCGEGRQGPRRADPLLRGRADARTGGRGLAERPRRGRAPGRQPHLRPRQPAGDEAGRPPVPLPPLTVADPRQDRRRGDRGQHRRRPRSPCRSGAGSRRTASARRAGSAPA